MLRFIKKFLTIIGIDANQLNEWLSKRSIQIALTGNGLNSLVEKIRKIEPDISNQEDQVLKGRQFNNYWELKRRGLHAFQCSLMLKAIKSMPNNLTVCDIGDSSGIHMVYLKELTKGSFNLNSVSVNLEHRSIEKIRERGLNATLCRAEDLVVVGISVNLFTSFQMVEHLHNPAIFFRRMAKKSNCNKMIITVPYLRNSRVGLHNIRSRRCQAIFAGDEHIFELNPDDWTLLMLHSGWKVVHSEIYYQYPPKWAVISQMLSLYWRMTDYEGFWGAILEKDTLFSDYYQDWED